MQSLYKKSSFVVLAAAAAALGLLFAPASVRAADPATTGGLSKGNPQSTFNINERDMPAVDNSLFRPPSAGYDASNGNVSVSNGEVRGNVYGGIDPATAGGVSNKNKVAMSDVTVGGNVTGGWSRSGTASENAVTITNNGYSVGGLVYGGWVRGGTSAGGGASKNIVTINSGIFNDNMYGGFSQGSNGDIAENQVIIKGGTIVKNVRPENDPHIIAGGYSSVGSNRVVEKNEVKIEGGTITNFWVYGGRGQTNATTITNNTVSISGGTIQSGGTHAGDKGSYIYGGEGITGSAAVLDNHVIISGGDVTATMYGGYARAGGAVTQNDVAISGGKVRGDIYGGYSVSGVATNNTVTIEGATTELIGVRLYGGATVSGGDAFTGNTLDKKSEADVSEAHNFQYVTFENYATNGNAKIGFLDTTASGSSQSGVTITTGSHDITFTGRIWGSGDVTTKAGSNKFIITGDNNEIWHTNGVTIESGTLQLGDGGAGGSIATEKYTLAAGTALAYQQSDAAAYTGQVTGAGKVVQRGSGTLLLSNTANNFTGGTEIESGTLLIADASYGKTENNAGSKSGYITFSKAGAAGERSVRLTASGEISLSNSFRTAEEAGTHNNVDLSSAGVVHLVNNKLAASEKGAALYVAENTWMTVTASNLVLGDETGASNAAGGVSNDLFIDTGGEFTLYTQGDTTFNSGIDGSGALNLRPVDDSRPYARVWLVSNQPTQNYSVGKTTVEGSADKNMVLFLARGDAGAGSDDGRVLFQHDTSFKMGKNAVLIGEGTVEAGDSITIDGAGGAAGIYPHITDAYGAVGDAAGTLKLVADEITLHDFIMGYAVGPSELDPPKTQDPLEDEPTFVTSNNSLLDFTTAGVPVTLGEGVIFIRTVQGRPFKAGDYLVMHSNNGFDADLSNLTVSFDGFTLNPDAAAPSTAREGAGLTFKRGGDPDTSTGAYNDSTNNNIWLTTGMNSLSMTWTGDTPSGNTRDGAWKSGAFFESEQTVAGNVHERYFLPGDKVYVSNDSAANIELQAFDAMNFTGTNVTVSGLVIGKTTEGGLAAEDASYTFSGAGGMMADKTSAHGDYLTTNPADEDSSTETNLLPTGKLEKFGDSTLTFTNEGVNMFAQGIELSGGTTQFTKAQQLLDGSYDMAKLAANVDGLVAGADGTRFLADSTLEALNDVELFNSVAIESGVIGGFSAAKDSNFVYFGNLTGDGTFNKSGAGTVALYTEALLGGDSQFAGKMTVSEGMLYVAGTYANADAEVHGGNGTETLSGTGVLKAGRVFANGTLAPGTVEDNLEFKGTLAFDAGSRFRVSLENNGTPRSEYVTVGGETTINPNAVLDVAFDYWGSKAKLTDVYRIIEAANGQTNETAEFTLGGLSSLPRGLAWEQGWNLAQRTGDEYQLKLVRDYGHGVDDIPGLSHNENEVGKIIDDMVDEPDGPMGEVVERVTDPDLTDDEARRRLNQLTGDLTANALYMAFKEPWRHPFNRLRHGSSAPPAGDGDPRLWAEYTSRYEETDSDGNAHDFTIERYGVALGLDHHISPRLTLGANLQFSRPTLKQDTGEVTADDLEIGLYGLAAVSDNLDMKMYLGYSWQRYDFERQVSLPASPAKYAALHENLDGETNGRAVAASIELIRPIDLRPDFRLSPALALDYEKVWVDAYTESGGLTALAYDDTEMEHVTLRAGLAGEYTWRDRALLKARAQYSAQIGGRDYPALGVHFAGDALARRADIRGASSGRHYLNLGLGGNFKIGDGENSLLYLNYDAKLNNRTSIHAAEAGVMLVW